MASKFLGSGSVLLDRVSGPVFDRFDDFDNEDDLRTSSDSLNYAISSHTTMLDDHDWRIDSRGVLRVTPGSDDLAGSSESRVENGPVFKKTKVPFGTKLAAPLGEMECGVCLCDIDASDLVVLPSCQHRYCSSCFSDYLDVQTGDIANIPHTLSYLEHDDRGFAHLRVNHTCGVACPHPKCTHILEGKDLKQFAKARTWQRFELLSFQISLQRLIRRGEVFMCPMQCGSVLQGCECLDAKCRKRTAILNRREQQRQLYLLNLWARAASARRCPRCGTIIEKNGGCDHMWCTNCKSPYNWSDSSL